MRLVIRLLFWLFAFQTAMAQPSACNKSFTAMFISFASQEKNIFKSLEILEISPSQEQKHRTAWRLQKQKIESAEDANGFGLLPSLKRGKFWAKYEFDDGAVLFAGAPRILKGQLWIPAFIRDRANGYRLAKSGYAMRYVSLKSLFKIMKQKFFEDSIDVNLTYLSRTHGFGRHKFELASIVKSVGENIILRNFSGEQKAISKFDFFVDNLVSVAGESNAGYLAGNSLSLDKIRAFFENGGKGTILYVETNSNAEVQHEGIKILIERLPRQGSSDLFSGSSYEALNRALKNGVQLLYSSSTSSEGTYFPPTNAISDFVKNRAFGNKSKGIISITDNIRDVGTIEHELSHLADSENPTDHVAALASLLNKNQRLGSKYQIDFSIFWTYVSEQRAHTKNEAQLRNQLESRQLDQEIFMRETFALKEFFQEKYLIPALAELRKLYAMDSEIATQTEVAIRSALLPSELLSWP